MVLENRVTDRAEVQATLTDPAFTMPPVPDGGPVPGIRWLRRQVVRFADGADHDRRRPLVLALLDDVPAAELQPAAESRTRALLTPGRPIDVMADIARVVPVDVLGAALGLPPVPASTVGVIGRNYQPNDGPDEAADEAVAQLVDAYGGVADEATAARISLLVQAVDATAGLVGSAVFAALRSALSPDQAVAETLLREPPAQVTRRVRADSAVTLDLAAAQLPFGTGPHHCPGGDHAVALATGVVTALSGATLVAPEIEYLPSALRIPAKLEVIP